ncbi:MAG: hypothetical protein LUG27_01005 [Clostridiales bacterium]|nr:hypothetical protein [Clostridiales bacterium]
MVAHGAKAQERERREGTDHGVFRAEKIIGHEKDQGRHDGRRDRFFYGRFYITKLQANHLTPILERRKGIVNQNISVESEKNAYKSRKKVTDCRKCGTLI